MFLINLWLLINKKIECNFFFFSMMVEWKKMAMKFPEMIVLCNHFPRCNAQESYFWCLGKLGVMFRFVSFFLLSIFFSVSSNSVLNYSQYSIRFFIHYFPIVQSQRTPSLPSIKLLPNNRKIPKLPSRVIVRSPGTAA
jgi:hypothetical protein